MPVRRLCPHNVASSKISLKVMCAWHDKANFSVYFSSRYISGKYNKINQLLLTRGSSINEGSYDNCRKNGISDAFISLL